MSSRSVDAIEFVWECGVGLFARIIDHSLHDIDDIYIFIYCTMLYKLHPAFWQIVCILTMSNHSLDADIDEVEKESKRKFESSLPLLPLPIILRNRRDITRTTSIPRQRSLKCRDYIILDDMRIRLVLSNCISKNNDLLQLDIYTVYNQNDCPWINWTDTCQLNIEKDKAAASDTNNQNKNKDKDKYTVHESGIDQMQMIRVSSSIGGRIIHDEKLYKVYVSYADTKIIYSTSGTINMTYDHSRKTLTFNSIQVLRRR
jgi:hypothetical protein